MQGGAADGPGEAMPGMVESYRCRCGPNFLMTENLGE